MTHYRFGPEDGFVDVVRAGRWQRTYDGRKIRYYCGRVRVPWLLWVMFS